MTKTQTVQIFWTIFLANVITHYHYTVCKVYKQYIVRLAISRSIFERYFERKIFFKEISIELVTEKDTQECNAVIGNSVSLVGIAKSENINKDAEFLDEIKKVLDKYETSEQFITARNQIENTYKAARAPLKKRIREEKQ